MKIGVYVGSFNPVHKGHVAIARGIIEKNLVDQLWVIVTGNYWNKQDLLPIESRIAMWRYYQDERIIIIDDCYNRIEKTYGVFRQLKKDYPENEFSLVIGADNLLSFERWVNYKELLENPFILVRRDENGYEEIEKILKGWNKENYQILDIPLIDISSSEIRANLDDYEKIKDKIDYPVYQMMLAEIEKNKQ